MLSKKNMSDVDRFVRIIIGGALMLIATYVPMSAALSAVCIVVGIVLMLTGLAGFCPLYALLNISTKK
ncbi:MAG: DUF2892 domain-containing protein [Candidatus Margulisbacteria bacterium]|nr:DUF2892 domain-containing protein [Candidatus Margulisiibacteriota bacterium]